MPAYVFSARDIRNGEFINEPGPARFLQVPTSQVPEPSHAISRGEWVARVAEGNPKSLSLYRHALRVTNYYSPFDEVLKLCPLAARRTIHAALIEKEKRRERESR